MMIVIFFIIIIIIIVKYIYTVQVRRKNAADALKFNYISNIQLEK